MKQQRQLAQLTISAEEAMLTIKKLISEEKGHLTVVDSFVLMTPVDTMARGPIPRQDVPYFPPRKPNSPPNN
jgi:hypothetical protein